MARVVPGSGAVIKPNFNKEFGVVSVDVISGGKNYSSADPPRLTIDNCGTPEQEALLWPQIDSKSGKILYVRVLESGKGYDPLRVTITPKQDSITVVNSFDPNRIWVSANTSVTTGRFSQYDRLKVKTNGLPDPAPYDKDGVFSIPYDHTFIFRGGKDVPNLGLRDTYNDQALGIMANGVELHTPDFYDIDSVNTISNYSYDVVKTPSLLSLDQYGGTTSQDNALDGKYFYTNSRLLLAYAAAGSTYHIAPYYKNSNYQGDRGRHPNGHSKIVGYSYDGYPIYGPYGYADPLVSSTVTNLQPSYRLRNTSETAAIRPAVVTPSTVTYTVTVAPGVLSAGQPGINRYYITGGGFTNEEKPFLNLQRGSTYIFNQDDPTNTTHPILFSPYGSSVAQGWHTSGQTAGDVNALWRQGVKYFIGNAQVTYSTYVSSFNSASLRRVEFTVPIEAPTILYYFCYNHTNMAEKIVVDGYPNGTFIQDNIYIEGLGDLDEFNGRYCKTPEYPNGTYAYFATVDANQNPIYPYFIATKFYGEEYLPGSTLPEVSLDTPSGASAIAVINPDNTNGEIQYIGMKSNGDGYFGDARVDILGGEGSGATANAVTRSVTGLSLISEGKNYLSPPNIFFQGGGGQGAKGVASIDPAGKLTSVTINNPGQYYNTPPYIIVDGGGGIGAKAEAIISQGKLTGVVITDPGSGYVSPPKIIFTKLATLKRKVRNRQAYDSINFNLCGLAAPVNVSQTSIFVDSTDAFPGSGTLMIDNEIIRYNSKSAGRFTGISRAVNFRFDQRVILDDDQNDPVTGNSTYQFVVGDRVVRRVDNASNKIAIVYDWKPDTRELFVKFQVDDLAFIDAGIPSSEERTITFDAGIAESSLAAQLPHTTEVSDGDFIRLFVGDPVFGAKVTPQVVLTDTKYVDDNDDGIPDLINTGTAFANQIALDGGKYNSLYGIEETIGGTNTTLFQLGDGISDASTPTKIATVDVAGALGDGIEHNADITITLDSRYNNTQNFFSGELIEGEQSGITAEVVEFKPSTRELILTDVTAFDTGNVNLGVNGKYYTFSRNSSIIGIKVVQPGTNYTLPPIITIQSMPTGVSAYATAVMSPSGDQIASVTMTVEGYGYEQYVDPATEILYPTITVTNAPGDTTGTGAVLEAIVGGEFIVGNNGARWRVEKIEYQTLIRNEFST